MLFGADIELEVRVSWEKFKRKISMQPQSITRTLVVGAIALGITASIQPPSLAQLNDYTYKCEFSRSAGYYTTYAITPLGNKPLIRWYSRHFSGSGYPPQVRCEEVAKRFQRFARIGALDYLTTGIVNREPVICVVGSTRTPCNESTVLYTLKPGENATEKLEDLFTLKNFASGEGPLWETGDSGRYVSVEALLNKIPVENTASSTPESSPSPSTEVQPSQPQNPSSSGEWP